MKFATPLKTSTSKFSIDPSRVEMVLWLMVGQVYISGLQYINTMDTEIKLRPPTNKLFLYVAMLAEREGFPIKVQPVDEHSFVFFIPYSQLADTVFHVIKDKHPDVKVKTVDNKIVFITEKGDREIVLEDVKDVVNTIYEKLKVRVAIDVPNDNELLIIVKAEPLAVMMTQLILKEVKKRNPDVIRLFKFLKGELNVEGFGYSMVVGVKYVHSDISRLEEMVS